MVMGANYKTDAACAILMFGLLFAGPSFSSGMKPASSVVLISEDQGETTMNVTNTDKYAALLYTSLETIPEDPELLLVVSPPVARVEGGDSQAVRFILQNKKPFTVQRLMRVTFEGIPTVQYKVPNSVGVTFRQNLPVIISPKGLKIEAAPWKFLKWSLCGDTLHVTNDSPYVVRLALSGSLQPVAEEVKFSKAYILPSTHHEFQIGRVITGATSMRIHPASVYGYALNQFDTPLSACTSQ
ncbi:MULTISPECIES: fimbria/pilus chaperone family protein [unclassified Pseudomonas]|uniref:fimbria/pilus chaperone family protein n=1 Tax=unclassified Pseudomonas TaxID=196821 RepID=UPI0015B160CD|nr:MULTISPECIES: fimbria/pilus chaperone family protein [unclassified Pseudomonas]